jgi:cytochrome d ubiquinol oxidase subunit II
MDEVQLFLANIWYFIIGLTLVLYVVLDGFTLGVGILSLFTRDDERRGTMMASLGSIWDANETWLVVLGGAMFGAFPLAFGVVLHALYIPIMLMIFGLIFRGVAFEYHEHARRKRGWGIGFGIGSLVAAAAQGLALGGVIGGLPVAGRSYAGGAWTWLDPFTVLVGVGVVFGYALIGATWLIYKTEGELQARCYHLARRCAWLMLAAGVGVTVWTPLRHHYVFEKWFSLPGFWIIGVLPLGAALAFVMLLSSLRRHKEGSPFLWSLGIFLFSFAGLGVSLYPNLVPPAVTVAAAAASSKTLVFMLTGIGMLLPVMLIYNAYQYLVFRGKVRSPHYDS